MGLETDLAKVEKWDVEKSKGRSKKKVVDDDDSAEDTGCWVKLRFIGSCIAARSKVDSSVSGTSTNYGNTPPPLFYELVYLLFLADFILFCLCPWPFEAFSS